MGIFASVTQNNEQMNKNTFVLSDESVNTYGFVIKTDGIDTTRFERNPVMLYMHERKTVVGRWDNIRKEGNKLLADAVFDESTELGKQVKAQVENGFLRSASIGVDIIEEKDINGVKTVTKCTLIECSIVDIPSNENALKLYNKGGFKRLALETPKKVEDLRTALVRLLGLDESATDEDIITEIENLLNTPDTATNEVEEAIKNGFVESKDRGDFVTMARLSPNAFHSFVSGQMERRKKAVKTAVDAALSEGRIIYQQRSVYERVGAKMGVETLALLFPHRTPRLSEMIDSGDRSRWTLADYRKFRPQDLKKNPKLYAELVAAENERSAAFEGSKGNLEYMRKHNPEYLKEHPEVYQKLLSNN